MFRYTLCAFFLLFATGKTVPISSVSQVIKLAFGVSKATYMPFSGSRYIKNGEIVGRTSSGLGYDKGKVVCQLKDWVASAYEKDNTELILFKHSGQKLAVFGFRGTEPTNIGDWKKNFDMELADGSIGSRKFKIHKGFRDRYLTIAAWFEERYRALGEDYRIVITGHSLGGALATIAAAYAGGKLQRPPDAVITFASPKVGDTDFVDYYKKTVSCGRTLRITAKFDVFTKVPSGKGYTNVCNALEVDGRKSNSWWASLNFLHNHSLYKGYTIGLGKKFSHFSEADFGCDHELS